MATTLRLSVRDTAAAVAHDFQVEADPDSSIESLLAALPLRVGDRTCYVGATPLDPESTLAESPLIPGATISVGAPGPDPRSLPPGIVGALRVVAGPDAGQFAWLPPGTHHLGRSADAAVRLRDEEVSRRHAELRVDQKGEVTVSDAGSTNGTFVAGVRVTAPRPLAPGLVLEVGDDRLEWVPLLADQLRVTRSPDGRLDFDRAFAPAPAITRAEAAMPATVTTSRNLAALLGPGLVSLVIGVVAAALLRQPAMLLFVLLGPVGALMTQLTERRQRASRERAFTEQQDTVRREISAHAATEERRRRLLAPDRLDLTLAATGAGRGLWPRNADSRDGLVLRVGTADRPASVDVRGEPWPGFEPPVLRGVPVTVDLRATGVFGVVGLVEPVNALARWLLVQLGTLRGPDGLRIVVIASTDDELAWTAWLPHLDAGAAGSAPCWIGNTDTTRAARVAELKALVTARMAARRSAVDSQFAEEVVVVLDGALALRRLSGMREVLTDGPSVGVYVICVDRQTMNECRGLCELDGNLVRLTHSRHSDPETARPEGIGRDTAEQLARALAPMRDRLTLAGAEAAIPHPVRFLDLLDIGVPTAVDVRRLWDAQEGPTTQVPLGADGSGTVTIDLAQQGPHTMLGGAPGAGKSILLQTLVTSLLLANRPDELNLVLVDFKGGGAFLPFKDCPHVVGLIRSTGETPADVFDEAAATRVLASVRAEVRRRESLLARFGGEIDDYWEARRLEPAMPALPRLVMIFDEFARVLESSPDFLKELVNVAAKGRSLGMHLVLATQSLQGKLSAELKNNIELRITLRQNEPADSVEVLGVPDAATIPGRLRGRGMLLCTKDETRTARPFQSGYLGSPPPAGHAPPARVRIVAWPMLGAPDPEERATHQDAPTDQALAIAAVQEAAGGLGLPAPFRPLLRPLPARLRLEDLERQATGRTPQEAAPFGLVDDPAGQSQPPACLDLVGTDRLLVAGGSESGRTTFARALITGLAGRFRPDQVHLYVVEHQPAGLAAYADLPHCGAVLSPAEPDRIRRLVTWLDAEVQRRRAARFAQHGQPAPWIVVIVDGWEHFENRSDPNFLETSLLGTLRGIITAGAALGVHVVAVGGQEMLSGRLPSLYSRRLLLRFPKEDIRRQHLPSGTPSPPVLPGRAVDAATGQHVQICWPALSAEELVTRATGTAAALDPTRLPRTFPPLPVRITIDQLQPPQSEPAATWIPIGVGGPDLATVGVDLFDAGPHLLLVSGPATSGRTTIAATLAHGLRRVGAGVLAVAPPRSPLPGLLPDDPGICVVTGTTIKDADLRKAAAEFGDGRYAVIVDDCEQLTLTPSQDSFETLPTLLHDIASPDALGRQALVLCGDVTPILTGQRRSLARILAEITTAGTRLLLTPTSPLTAREHGFTLEPDQYFAGPPGRGYLTTGRTADLIHTAISHDAPA